MAAGWRIVLAYLVYFGAIGASYPYLQVFYHDLGLTFEEIGVLTAIQAGTQLVLGPVCDGHVLRFGKGFVGEDAAHRLPERLARSLARLPGPTCTEERASQDWRRRALVRCQVDVARRERKHVRLA